MSVEIPKKSDIDSEPSPVRAQDSALLDCLKEHDKNGVLAFHMPGHKRKGYDFLLGADKIDITEIDGFDNLHDASGIILECEKNASRLFNSLCSAFLVNGSTSGILAGIRTLCKEGDKILVARNCHKSVFNAAELMRLSVIYAMPSCLDSFFGSVRAEDIEKALLQNPDIRCVVLTSPTYEGVVSDIRAIADICHAHGATLFVDEAHGAHLSLCEGFETSARELGADLVVNSLHKTLPSLTQTAILHVCSQRVDITRLNKNLAVFQTSSPSYVLMSSIDGCVRHIMTHTEELEAWSEALDRARARLAGLKRLSLFAPDASKLVYAYDKSKLVILCDKASITGVELKRILRERYSIELEMAGINYAIAMSGAGDSDTTLNCLCDALLELDRALAYKQAQGGGFYVEIAEKQLEPYQIDTLSCEYVDFNSAEGRVCAESIWAYPPGCPLIVKGERLSQEAIDEITRLHKTGVSVASEERQLMDKVLVLCDKSDF